MRCLPLRPVAWMAALLARLLRANLRSMVMGVFELLRAWFAPGQNLRGKYEVEGLDALRATLAQGQGVLLLLGHFPHTELAVRFLGEALGRRMDIAWYSGQRQGRVQGRQL